MVQALEAFHAETKLAEDACNYCELPPIIEPEPTHSDEEEPTVRPTKKPRILRMLIVFTSFGLFRSCSFALYGHVFLSMLPYVAYCFL